MTYSVTFKPVAEKAFSKLTKDLQKRIYNAALRLADDPRPSGYKKLHGLTDLDRIRVGDYRIVYTVNDQGLQVLIVNLGHRREIYR